MLLFNFQILERVFNQIVLLFSALLDFARQGRQFNGNSQCCQTLSLNLRNQPNARQGLFNQLYTVQPNQINGREYWATADRSLAIWFTRRNVWCIGQSVNLGSETCSFHSR